MTDKLSTILGYAISGFLTGIAVAFLSPDEVAEENKREKKLGFDHDKRALRGDFMVSIENNAHDDDIVVEPLFISETDFETKLDIAQHIANGKR